MSEKRPPGPSTDADPCPDCGGRGWVVEADGGAGRARRCRCQSVGRESRLWAAAGVPARYAHCRISSESFEVNHPQLAVHEQLLRAQRASQAYVEKFLDMDGTGFTDLGLIFVGRAGAGKTHLAVGILYELIRTYSVRGRFVDFTELIHRLQATFDPGSPGSTPSILNPILSAELLVLDELGSQRPTPWVQDVLYRLINTRYAERRPTLMTTNYRLEEPAPVADPASDENVANPRGSRGLEPLSHRLPAPLVSRLFEMATVVTLDAVVDYRQQGSELVSRRG